MKLRERTNWRLLGRVEKKFATAAAETAREGALVLRDDIRSNWYPTSPSPVGGPPAIDTGNLDSSIFVENVGRDVKGRFAEADKAAFYLVIDTEKGKDPRNRGQYAAAVEERGRPFLQPAMDRVAAVLPYIFKRKVT